MKYTEMEATVIKKYCHAKEIYLLRRTKKMTKKEIFFDWMVALFTPLPGIVEEADLVSDMGCYFLVKKESRYLLVRADKKEITERDITGLASSFEEKKFVVENNRFIKVKKIYG